MELMGLTLDLMLLRHTEEVALLLEIQLVVAQADQVVVRLIRMPLEALELLGKEMMVELLRVKDTDLVEVELIKQVKYHPKHIPKPHKIILLVRLVETD